ncbi:MAG: CarD family transcriptional regulator, partial [Hyphomicrobiales bacterium]|nr:CarD family transcriptional regulator [Hyphomicrobiales bacterium]
MARTAHASPPAGAAAAKAAPGLAKEPKTAIRDDASRPAKASGQRHGFKLNEFVVYPAHGVGQIVAVE